MDAASCPDVFGRRTMPQSLQESGVTRNVEQIWMSCCETSDAYLCHCFNSMFHVTNGRGMLLSMKLRSALAPCGSGQVYVYQPTKETSPMGPLCLDSMLLFYYVSRKSGAMPKILRYAFECGPHICRVSNKKWLKQRHHTLTRGHECLERRQVKMRIILKIDDY